MSSPYDLESGARQRFSLSEVDPVYPNPETSSKEVANPYTDAYGQAGKVSQKLAVSWLSHDLP